MGERTSYAPGTFCWVELATTDGAAAKEFYGGLFGWGSENLVGPHDMFTLSGKEVGAMYEQTESSGRRCRRTGSPTCRSTTPTR